MLSRRSHFRNRSGYSLTEVAVTLGIVGIVLAAVWVAYGAATTAYKANKLVKDMDFILANFNNLGYGYGDFPQTAACFSYSCPTQTNPNATCSFGSTANPSSSYIAAISNVAPPDMFSDPSLNPANFSLLNPWGNTFTILLDSSGNCSSGSGNSTGSLGQFVEFNTGNMPSSACERLLLDAQNTWDKIGFSQLCVNNCVWNSGWLGNPAVPLTINQITQACSTSSSVQLLITFNYPLQSR